MTFPIHLAMIAESIAPKTIKGTNTPPVSLLVFANNVKVIRTNNTPTSQTIATFPPKRRGKSSCPVDTKEKDTKPNAKVRAKTMNILT